MYSYVDRDSLRRDVEQLLLDKVQSGGLTQEEHAKVAAFIASHPLSFAQRISSGLPSAIGGAMAGSLIFGPIGMLLGGVAGAALGVSANSEIVRRQREEIIWAAVREILRDDPKDSGRDKGFES